MRADPARLGEAGPIIVRLPVSPTVRRSPAARRQARRRALDAHLAGARRRHPRPRAGASPPGAGGARAHGGRSRRRAGRARERGRRTLGLGWVSALDLEQGAAHRAHARRTRRASRRSRSVGSVAGRREDAMSAPRPARRGPARSTRSSGSALWASRSASSRCAASRSASWRGGGVDGVDGRVDGAVEDGGDADGMRSPGRSPTRSVRDSLQAVSMPAPSARAHRPVSILFMLEPPPCGGCAIRPRIVATDMPPTAALTGSPTAITNAGDPRMSKGDLR